MAKDRRRALMACSNYWGSPFQVGSHRIARELVKDGWDVAFIGDPVSPIDFISPSARREVGARWSNHRNRGERDLEGHLWSYVPASLIAPHNRPLLRSRWVHRHWHRLALSSPAKVAAQAGFGEVDLLYIDSFSQGFWLDAIPHRRSIYRMADLNRFQKRYCAAAEWMEKSIIRRVDRVLTPSRRLSQIAEEMGAQAVTYFPNGGPSSDFLQTTRPRSEDLASIPGPIAVYMGVMPEWFDFDLIRLAASRLPDVSFVLIGPDRLAQTRLQGIKNVYLLGVRPYPDLPAYLPYAQVGLMPFDVRRYPDIVSTLHPQKLYAYSACGLPTVAPTWDELKQLHSPAILCADEDEFVAGIEKALNHPIDRETLQRFARESDWSARMPLFLELTR